MALGKRKRVYGKLGTQARAVTNNDDMFFPTNPDTSQKPPPVAIKPKPQSQKEAMMASEPSAEDVEAVVMFTDTNKATAIRYLRVSVTI